MESDLHIYSVETDAFLAVFVLCTLRAIKNLIATCLGKDLKSDQNFWTTFSVSWKMEKLAILLLIEMLIFSKIISQNILCGICNVMC